MGTIINTVAIVLGGTIGYLFGSKINEKTQETLTLACGISVLFIGISGTLEKMFTIQDSTLTSNYSILLVLSLTIGGFIGESLDIEDKFETFGEWLKQKTGNANLPTYRKGQ